MLNTSAHLDIILYNFNVLSPAQCGYIGTELIFSFYLDATQCLKMPALINEIKFVTFTFPNFECLIMNLINLIGTIT